MDFNNADAIFIPSDIKGDRTDYTEFKAKLFRVVPENCVLVKQGRLTGRITMPKSGLFSKIPVIGGLHLTIPFLTKSIFVPIIDRTIDYPKAEYYTKDKIAANIDIALKVRIVNPELFVKFGRYQLDQLNVLTQNLLLEYVKKREFEDLQSGRIDLKEFDSKEIYEIEKDDKGKIIKDENGEPKRKLVKTLDESAYEDFLKRYGIEVKSVQLKSIKLPESLQKLYDDEREEERKKAAQKIRLQAEKERYAAEEEFAEMRGKAKAKENKLVEQTKIDIMQEKIERLSNILENKGLSQNEISDVIRMFTASEAGAAVIYGSQNDGTVNIAKSVAAGNIASEQIKERKKGRKLSNSESFVNEIEFFKGLEKENPEAYQKLEKLEKLVTSEPTRSYIDSYNEQQFISLKNKLYQDIKIEAPEQTEDYEEVNTKKR